MIKASEALYARPVRVAEAVAVHASETRHPSLASRRLGPPLAASHASTHRPPPLATARIRRAGARTQRAVDVRT
jgi:hypothetical protein